MSKALFTSIIFLLNQLNAQQGIGCAEKTCPIPGQIRVNAVYNPQGEYLSGCNCMTPIAPPVFIPQTPPITIPVATQPNLLFLLPPQAPVIPPVIPQPRPANPQTTKPIGTSMTVICGEQSLCACPAGHIGECKIICEGSIDACKDTLIECNNDGYDCIVDCLTQNACSSNCIINGPIDGSLTVNCLGEKSCEGDSVFNGKQGTDLTVICNGMTTCKDAFFYFGVGMGRVECNGNYDACVDAQFNLLSNTRGFGCFGSKCPINAPKAFELKPTNNPTVTPTKMPTNNPILNPTKIPTLRPTSQPTTKTPTMNPTTKRPTNDPTLNPTKRPTLNPTNNPTTPIPTSSPTPRPTPEPTKCITSGDCQCTPHSNIPCKIECNGASDACKDGLIECNNDGYDCIVDCTSQEACSGSSIIIGPVGASLTVNCFGSKSCQGSVSIEGGDGIDTTILCAGGEACKGSGVSINFGSGIGQVFCSGNPDSCNDARFNVPANAVAYQCIGSRCPSHPTAFGFDLLPHVGPPVASIDPVLIVRPQGQQPGQSPTNHNPGSPFCCRTSLLNFIPWKGLCWSQTNEYGCLDVANSRCIWDPNDCLPNPPVNTYGKECKFAKQGCVDNSECCAETCIRGSFVCR